MIRVLQSWAERRIDYITCSSVRRNSKRSLDDGLALPLYFDVTAELAVAPLLIGLGGYGLWRLSLAPAPSGHRPPTDGPVQRRAVLIGALHGVAGSVPVMALIPLARATDAAAALLYLLCFSGGVLIAMLAFSGLLVRFRDLLAVCGPAMMLRFQSVVACATVAVGVYLIVCLV